LHLPESEPLWHAGRGFVVRRSAPVSGRSNVAKQTVIGLTGAFSRQDIAAAGDGRTPPSIL
jgi:hypothetical protein